MTAKKTRPPVAETGRGERRKADSLALVLALARGSSQREASAELGIAERTIYRRLRTPSFRAEVARARERLIECAAGKLADEAAKSVAMLAAVRDDVSHPITTRVRAATALLAEVTTFQEHGELLARIGALEARLAALDPQTVTTPAPMSAVA